MRNSISFIASIDMLIFDDVNQKQIIEQNEESINQLQGNIDRAKNRLDRNNKFKSILYSNGDELVEVVFEMLEQILDYNMSDFID